MYENIKEHEWKAIKRYQVVMAQETAGSRRYELARKHFRDLCELIRRREKSDLINTI